MRMQCARHLVELPLLDHLAPYFSTGVFGGGDNGVDVVVIHLVLQGIDALSMLGSLQLTACEAAGGQCARCDLQQPYMPLRL